MKRTLKELTEIAIAVDEDSLSRTAAICAVVDKKDSHDEVIRLLFEDFSDPTPPGKTFSPLKLFEQLTPRLTLDQIMVIVGYGNSMPQTEDRDQIEGIFKLVEHWTAEHLGVMTPTERQQFFEKTMTAHFREGTHRQGVLCMIDLLAPTKFSTHPLWEFMKLAEDAAYQNEGHPGYEDAYHHVFKGIWSLFFSKSAPTEAWEMAE